MRQVTAVHHHPQLVHAREGCGLHGVGHGAHPRLALRADGPGHGASHGLSRSPAKARGAGYRTIAASFGRPESTVRRWLRAAREPHAQWLYGRAVNQTVTIDRELLVRPAPQQTVRPAPQQTTLGHALNLLAGAARAVPRMLRPQRPGLVADRLLRSRAALGRSAAAAAQLKFGFRRALPRPAPPVTMQTKPAFLSRTTVTLPTKPSRCRRNSENRSASSTKPSSAASATVNSPEYLRYFGWGLRYMGRGCGSGDPAAG